MSVCATCRGYGFARGGVCWTCNDSPSEPGAEGFAGHLVTPKDGGRPIFYPAGEDFTLTASASVTPLYAAFQRQPTQQGGAEGPKKISVLKSAIERLILAADMYGVSHLDSDDMDDDAVELQDATESMKDVLAALKTEKA
jgi:hypothetical protein